MSNPTISVVMSVYNGERYLREAVESILAQTFGDFEFIIVNDGSTDGSRDILAEYAARDSRIRIIDQENQGLTKALIRACAEAKGRFIARQDSDDRSHPERLHELLALAERAENVVMVSSSTNVIDPMGDVVARNERNVSAERATHQLLHERIGPPGHGSVMFRRDAYLAAGGYRSPFYFAQDVDLWLRLAHIGLLAYVAEYLYAYRVDPVGISGQQSERQIVFGELARQCLDARLAGQSEEPLLQKAQSLREQIEAERGRKRGLRRQRAGANYRIGTGLSRLGNPRAKEYFWAAIRLNPLHWRSWCRLGWEYGRGLGRKAAPTDVA